jgi:hypothetical protein
MSVVKWQIESSKIVEQIIYNKLIAERTLKVANLPSQSFINCILAEHNKCVAILLSSLLASEIWYNDAKRELDVSSSLTGWGHLPG